jgi:putative heme-binding domain-containing protein
MEDLVPLLDRRGPGGSADRGRKVFRDTGCIQCHRIEGEGGTVGPDMNGIARRMAPKELLESIVEPSRVIAEAYAGVRVATHDGTLHSGHIEREDDRVLVLRPAPSAEAVTIPKAEIAERRRSDQSNMPAGMLNVLREEQILDLMAYLLGDPPPRSQKP